MIKSGSTLLAHYTIELVRKVFPQTGQQALCEAVEAKKLPGLSFFVSRIDAEILAAVEGIARQAGPVVLKLHAGVEPVLTEALKAGRIRMTFTHRDPRDMILSAMDHAKRSKGSCLEPEAFQEFSSIPESLIHAWWWAEMACKWVDSGLAHVVRYADLVTEPAWELRRLAEYLELEVDASTIAEVIREERAGRQLGQNQFFRGRLSRYPDEMTVEQQVLCWRRMGRFIKKLGYPRRAPQRQLQVAAA